MLMTWWGALALNAFRTIEEPYFWHFFVGFSLTNILFLTAVGLSAYMLFILRQAGLYILAAILVGELIYWLALGSLWRHPTLGTSAASATGVGNMGISPQVVIAYPVTGLLTMAILAAVGVWRRP
jgi:hypothetical protein